MCLCNTYNPPAILEQSPAKVFLSHTEAPPPPPPPHTHTHLPEDDSSRSRNIDYRLSTVKVSTTNTDRPHQRWTCQLLRAWKRPASSPLNTEALQLPHLSTLKLFSLLLASGACISPPRTWPPPPTDNEVMLYRNGGHNCTNKPSLCFVLRLRLQKGGGVFAGHYGTKTLLLEYFCLRMCTWSTYEV